MGQVVSGPSNETENEKRLERIAAAMERSAEANEKTANMLERIHRQLLEGFIDVHTTKV